jgi:uncharacterized membrane protein
MVRTLIGFANLLLVSLVVGTMFGIWLGYNPATLSSATYVEQQQQAIRALNTLLPLLGGCSIVLTLVSAWLVRYNRLHFSLLLVAAGCLVVAGVVTRFGNQPINREVMTWSAQAPPANWMDFRDSWWRWHVVRTVSGLGGLSCLIWVAVSGQRVAR